MTKIMSMIRHSSRVTIYGVDSSFEIMLPCRAQERERLPSLAGRRRLRIMEPEYEPNIERLYEQALQEIAAEELEKTCRLPVF